MPVRRKSSTLVTTRLLGAKLFAAFTFFTITRVHIGARSSAAPAVPVDAKNFRHNTQCDCSDELFLHGYSASGHLQKEKHLEVMGIPVGYLSRAL